MSKLLYALKICIAASVQRQQLKLIDATILNQLLLEKKRTRMSTRILMKQPFSVSSSFNWLFDWRILNWIELYCIAQILKWHLMDMCGGRLRFKPSL